MKNERQIFLNIIKEFLSLIRILYLLNVFVNLEYIYFRGTFYKPFKLQASIEYIDIISAIGERLLLLYNIH